MLLKILIALNGFFRGYGLYRAKWGTWYQHSQSFSPINLFCMEAKIHSQVSLDSWTKKVNINGDILSTMKSNTLQWIIKRISFQLYSCIKTTLLKFINTIYQAVNLYSCMNFKGNWSMCMIFTEKNKLHTSCLKIAHQK